MREMVRQRQCTDTSPNACCLVDPDLVRGGGAGVRADAADPRRHLRRAPGRRRRAPSIPTRRRRLPRRDRHRPAARSCSSWTSSGAPCRLDFGISMWSGKPVITEIAARLPISLEIALLATVVAVIDRHPARHDLGAEAEHLDRRRRAHLRHRRHRHAVVLDRHRLHPAGARRHQRDRSARPGCRRSTMCRSGRTRSATCRWRSCRRSPSATATPRSACA